MWMTNQPAGPQGDGIPIRMQSGIPKAQTRALVADARARCGAKLSRSTNRRPTESDDLLSAANSVTQMHIENCAVREFALSSALRRCIERVLATKVGATVAGAAGHTRPRRSRLSSGFTHKSLPVDDGVKRSPPMQVIAHGRVDHTVATGQVICWVEPRRKSDGRCSAAYGRRRRRHHRLPCAGIHGNHVATSEGSGAQGCRKCT